MCLHELILGWKRRRRRYAAATFASALPPPPLLLRGVLRQGVERARGDQVDGDVELAERVDGVVERIVELVPDDGVHHTRPAGLRLRRRSLASHA